MKKNVFVAVLLLCVSVSYGQLNFGIKAGYNSSLGVGSIGSVGNGGYNLQSVNSELKNGFHTGVFVRLGINSMYIQPELLYTMGSKNYKVTLNDATSNNLTYDKLVNISTVDIPLLIGYKLVDLKVANMRVFAGPKLRLNAGSTLEFSNFTKSGGTLTQADLVQDIKAAQLGLEAGVGIDVLMFTLDARYNLIGDMYQTKLNGSNIDNWSANTFVISLGWKLF